MHDVTQILSAMQRGDPLAAEELLPLVYDELRRLAAEKMAQEQPGKTLQATAIVHEAYIRLVDAPNAQRWNSRRHFFAAAAEAMRRILVEEARRKRTLKAGGQFCQVGIPDLEQAAECPQLDILALHEALERLAEKSPRSAQLVKLRFFAGLTNQQAADALGIAASTADADWAYAKCWLRLEMTR